MARNAAHEHHMLFLEDPTGRVIGRGCRDCDYTTPVEGGRPNPRLIGPQERHFRNYVVGRPDGPTRFKVSHSDKGIPALKPNRAEQARQDAHKPAKKAYRKRAKREYGAAR